MVLQTGVETALLSTGASGVVATLSWWPESGPGGWALGAHRGALAGLDCGQRGQVLAGLTAVGLTLGSPAPVATAATGGHTTMASPNTKTSSNTIESSSHSIKAITSNTS